MRRDEAIAQVEYLRGLVEQTRVNVASFAPHLVFWGIVWVVGYVGNLWVPWIWGVLWPIGMVGSAVIGAVTGRAAPSATPLLKRVAVVNVALFVGTVVFPMVLLGGQCEGCSRGLIAYWPLAIGLLYVVNGVLLELRALTLIGGWLAVAALASTAMPRAVALVWMACAGGGSMVVSGLVVRRLGHQASRRRRHLEAV